MKDNLTVGNSKIDHLLSQVKRGWSLPQPFYTDQEVFEYDMQNIHYKYWLYVGHASQIKKNGDYFTYEIGKESIIIIRDKNLDIKAYFNVCPHRGSRICLNETGNQKVLVCPYHQWSFNLAGELMNNRMMGDDFDKLQFNLKKVHLEVIEDLIFISLAKNPPSFDCMYNDVLPKLKSVGMKKAKVAFTQTYDVQANWKLIIENFRECYHCHVGHPEYIRVVEGIHKNDPEHVEACFVRWQSQGFNISTIPFTSDTWHHCQRYPFHQGNVTESLDGQPVAPLMGDYTDHDMGTFAVMTHPNFLLETSSDHAVTMRHTPVSPTVTRLTITWLVDENAVEGVDYDVDKVIAFWKITGEQDWKLCANNQAGVNSMAYKPGPYGLSEPEILKFQDWYLGRIIESNAFSRKQT